MFESIQNELLIIVTNFEFIRPWVLLCIIPLVLIYIVKLKYSQAPSAMKQVLPKHLYQNLVVSESTFKLSRFVHIASLCCLLAILAAAGPSWQKLPQPVYKNETARVIVLDMSMSMRSTDIQPNRLSRARFKTLDLINQLADGETGLIAYAGDAFVVSPLTDDVNTIASLIPSLSPEIMPSQGSNVIYALERASELLNSAGYPNGDIFWITDGIRYDEIKPIRDFVLEHRHQVNSILVGTEQGAPITLENGSLLKDNSGRIVIPGANIRYMRQALNTSQSKVVEFSNTADDIAQVIEVNEQIESAKLVEDLQGDTAKDAGPFLLLLLVPVAAYCFRKGVLVSLFVAFVVSGSLQPQISFAAQESAQNNNTERPFTWLDKAFKNDDQRAKQAFDDQNFNQASALFDDPSWKAASAYKNGDYALASELYTQLEGLENIYNLANSLAKQGKLQEALEKYEEVLATNKDHQNALKNKQIVESLLEQQEQQPQDNQQSQDQDQSSQSDSESDSSQSDQQSSSEQQNSNSKQEQSSQNSEQQGEQQEQDSQQNSEQQASQDQQESNSTSQEQNQQEQAQQAPTQEGIEEEQNESEEQEQIEAISANELNEENLSPEELEQMQRMQTILNQVPDDPAYLLHRKMLIEAYKRQNRTVPNTEEKW